MDFPLFHLDWLNNRFLIAVIAIIHVLINHGLAVGFYPYVTWMEQKAVINGGADRITHPEWDLVAKKMMKTGFIVTTTIGALTGVGIWFSTSLVSPASIGSLIRVFFWAWFTEWTVFVTEVILVCIYYLTWENSNKSLKAKALHVKFGWLLAAFSFITMVLIVAILSFMMNPGNWNTHHSFWNGFMNPIYIPQMCFRLPVAMVLGGLFGLILTYCFTKKKSDLRPVFIKLTSKWLLVWLPIAFAGGWFYYHKMPETMRDNMSVALGTMQFQLYYNVFKYMMGGVIVLIFIIAIWGTLRPQKLKWGVTLPVFILGLGFMGYSERVREFIRKPYIIGGYMYSNLLREEDYPLYKKDGILKYATYSSVSHVTPENKQEAGKNVFMLSCSRCHTASGVNDILYVFERMYGKDKPLDIQSMMAYIPNMHNGRPYMPPFPGNKEELEALCVYIKSLQTTHDPLEGAQVTGAMVNPVNSADSVLPLFEKKGITLRTAPEWSAYSHH